MSHVVILGGGFGGLAAAHELRTAHPELDVTVVDRRDHFFMGFAKLWDLAGIRPLVQGTRSLDALAGRGVRFVQADVVDLDAAGRRVTIAGGEVLEADALIIALGAAKAPPHLALLEAPSAHDLYDGAALPDIHADLDAITAGRVVVSILGGPFLCPPAPFEAALAVDERLRRRGVRHAVSVAISTPQPMTLPVAGVDASRYVAQFLAERDVELLAEAKVESVADGVIGFADGRTSAYDVLLGVPAAVAPRLLVDAGLTGASGFIEPDVATLKAEKTIKVGRFPWGAAVLPKDKIPQ